MKIEEVNRKVDNYLDHIEKCLKFENRCHNKAFEVITDLAMKIWEENKWEYDWGYYFELAKYNEARDAIISRPDIWEQ